jgi:hypothetical protein
VIPVGVERVLTRVNVALGELTSLRGGRFVRPPFPMARYRKYRQGQTDLSTHF